MNISGVHATQAVQTAQTKEPSALQIVTAPEHGQPADTVEISPRRSHQSSMYQDTERTIGMKSSVLRRMAERMIKEQYTKGNHLFMLFYGGTAVRLDPSLRPDYHLPELEIDSTQREVVENASEYFGPEETSGRIINAAMDIAGPDALNPPKEMVSSFRRSVSAAFDSVKAMFDGVMPELTQRTFEATMRRFDTWGGGSTAAAAPAADEA
ncbi:MAG: hypothetical protein LBR72_04955 [Oscillospiraceae bacterium]|jgi:hypothetical protein|nr:hypothetical protein [Oscillospiraceae bacterium]